MEAPKVIWAYVRHKLPDGMCGMWDENCTDALDARYIRADAPELVALVEALRDLSDVVCVLGLDASGHTLSAINKADKANAAWEALTK